MTEIDLTARHDWLREQADGLDARLLADHTWFDAKIAGLWVWGLSAWVGRGWGGAKRDVKRPIVSTQKGVFRGRLWAGDAREGSLLARLRVYFRVLAQRCERVTIYHGDWAGVLRPAVTQKRRVRGVVLDPPYSGGVREPTLYRIEDHTVATDAREWALAHGDDPSFRIVLCGYVSEHDARIPGTWRRVRWSSAGAGGNFRPGGRPSRGAINRQLETLWFSPHCLSPEESAPEAVKAAWRAAA